MNLIDKTQELQDACKILKKQKVIAIDCEFIREKTFFPIPCLIQVGYEDGAFLIDPLAENMDFGDFFALLQNKKVLKVFHSGRQDIEILYNLSGAVPTPVFDTQIARRPAVWANVSVMKIWLEPTAGWIWINPAV